MWGSTKIARDDMDNMRKDAPKKNVRRVQILWQKW